MNQPATSYEITAEVSVKRIKHRVNFHQGGSLNDLISTLQMIKPRGTIEIDDFGHYDDNDTWGWIEFHEEFAIT